MFVVAILGSWLPVSATAVGTGLISQLTYLGNASQPDRIPLSPVIYNANHNYGSHDAIFQSRPCYHGHFLTNSRPEYEQNLAVIYGISCDLSDSTQMVGCTATFTLRKPQLPTHAPYTQEQVFAASLQTLLMYSYGMTQENPLTIVIKAEGIPQPAWAAKYARAYFYTEEEIKNRVGGVDKPLAVAGIKIDTTSLPGATYLVLEGVKPDPKIPELKPAFVPFISEGENDSGMCLVPLWPGTSWGEDPIGVIARPDLPYYEKWGASSNATNDAKPHQSYPTPLGYFWRIIYTEEKSLCTLEIEQGEMTTEQFATFLFSCIATLKPTEERPLHFIFRHFDLNEEYLSMLEKQPVGDDGFSLRFVFDAKTMKITKGVVPGYEMNYEYGRFRVMSARENENKLYDPNSTPTWIVKQLATISNDLPLITDENSKEFITTSKVKLMKWALDGQGDVNDILHTMLMLNHYENDPWFFASLGSRDKNRVTRAVAGCFAEKAFVLVGEEKRQLLQKPLQEMPYDPWVDEIRSRGMDDHVQSLVAKAIEAWRKRCDTPKSDPSSLPNEEK